MDVYTGGSPSIVEEFGFGSGEKGYAHMQCVMAEFEADPLIAQYAQAATLRLWEAGKFLFVLFWMVISGFYAFDRSSSSFGTDTYLRPSKAGIDLGQMQKQETGAIRGPGVSA